MHNNYYFLKHLSSELNQKIVGCNLKECFTQNKNELILVFANGKNKTIIKALFNPNFCCLSFPQEFHRARKNSLDLFESASQKMAKSVFQFSNERAFSINLEEGFSIIFKLHGNRSNILLSKDDKVIALFNNKLEKDIEIKPTKLDRKIDQSFEAFRSNPILKEIFPTFGNEIHSYLSDRGFEQLDVNSQWKLIEETHSLLNDGNFYVTSSQFSLFPIDNARIFRSPIQAISEFFRLYITDFHLNTEKKKVLSNTSNRIKRGNNYLKKITSKLNEITRNSNHRIYGDIIMANLHGIPANAKEVELNNFYDNNKTIKIPLKSTLSAQKNAEVYYKKAKNQSIEIDNLKSNIIKKENELAILNEHQEQIKSIDDFKVLKSYLAEYGLANDDLKQTPALPYHKYNHDGFVIWVGKNAKANDRMLQLTYKEDLWLHAKDVTGSHVIIKHQSGNPTPGRIKERAASLAAYYSKRKTDSLCPVIVTPRKFVRKRKGDPAGAVVVDKELEVLLVKPEN